MSFAKFLQAPWKTSHETYQESIFSISPSPAYANSEVLIASLYRTIGFQNINEPKVPLAGRDFERKIQKFLKKESSPDDAVMRVDLWNTTLHWVLESPKLPNQSTKRFLQVSPLVPNTALFSGSARLTGNSWPAGTLVQRMLWMGSSSDTAASALWRDLFDALSVCNDDDIFAQFLQKELAAWLENPEEWRFVEPQKGARMTFCAEDYSSSVYPARQFVKDLTAMIQAKSSMTRRQWISLLDAILRLASVSHVMWLCKIQSTIWEHLEHVLRHSSIQNVSILSEHFQYITYGNKAITNIKDLSSRCLKARLGINYVLWALDEVGRGYKGTLSSSSDVMAFCEHLKVNRELLVPMEPLESIEGLFEEESRALLCKTGIGSNLVEFSRHVLGQRQTADPILRGYDQGYVLRKKSIHPSSPWIVSLGPASILALVHCALSGFDTPRSIHRLSQHLYHYGIANDRNEISRNELGHQLRMLGLILDSPDAESGMLLLPPFPVNIN